MGLLILCIDLLSMGGLDFWRISVQLFAQGKQTVGFFLERKSRTPVVSLERKCEKGEVILFHCFFPLTMYKSHMA